MIIFIKELCEVDTDNTDDETTGFRVTAYDAKSDNLTDALKEYDSELFDDLRIMETDDDFEGTCIGSEIIKVSASYLSL